MSKRLPFVKPFLFLLWIFSAIFWGRQQPTSAHIPITIKPITQVVYPPTEDRGAPSRTTGSGTRDQCSLVGNSAEEKLTALTPLNNVSTTANPHPTLYFYVPTTQSTSAELTLYNDDALASVDQALELADQMLDAIEEDTEFQFQQLQKTQSANAKLQRKVDQLNQRKERYQADSRLLSLIQRKESTQLQENMKALKELGEQSQD